MAEPDSRLAPQPDSRLVVASRNAGKVAEMHRLLVEHLPTVQVLGLADVAAYDEPVEDQPSFEGNALLKARAGVAATGLPCVADDSGLCVDELRGMPGVLSARWSGRPKSDERNNLLLLDQLLDTPEERRGAEFRCVVACALPDGRTLVVDGVMRGRVIRELRGEGGFGYDALFVPDEQDGALTSAEMTPGAKDAVSHRGRAQRALAPQLPAFLAG